MTFDPEQEARKYDNDLWGVDGLMFTVDRRVEALTALLREAMEAERREMEGWLHFVYQRGFKDGRDYEDMDTPEAIGGQAEFDAREERAIADAIRARSGSGERAPDALEDTP